MTHPRIQSTMALVVAAVITGALTAGLSWVTEVGSSKRPLAADETSSAVAPPSRRGPGGRDPEVGGRASRSDNVGGAISRVAGRVAPYT